MNLNLIGFAYVLQTRYADIDAKGNEPEHPMMMFLSEGEAIEARRDLRKAMPDKFRVSYVQVPLFELRRDDTDQERTET